MTQAEDIESAVAANAQGPARFSGDLGTSEQHSLPDQIAAAQFVAANAGVKNKNRGLRFTKMQAPGTVL